MDDLISRKDAISALKALEESAPTAQHVSAVFDCEDTIRALPSVEPEPKKGKWVPHPGDEDWDVCSVCGTGCKRRERGISQYIPWVTEYNYQFCPNCGAEMMRGEE